MSLDFAAKVRRRKEEEEEGIPLPLYEHIC